MGAVMPDDSAGIKELLNSAAQGDEKALSRLFARYRSRLKKMVRLRLNRRLQVKIQPFKLTRRQVLIDRLVHDPQVMEAVDEHCAENDMPRDAAMRASSASYTVEAEHTRPAKGPKPFKPASRPARNPILSAPRCPATSSRK